MAHGVPLTSALGKNNCGAAGPFFLDAGISSTHHIANFWRLGEGHAETSRATAAPGIWVLAADTTVTIDGAILGKEEGGAAWDDPTMVATLEKYIGAK